MSLYLKSPHARIDHVIDWSADLSGQSVMDSAWSVSPDEAGGLSVEDSAIDAGQARARLGGGLVGQVYRLTNGVTVSDGRMLERSVTFRVEEL